MTETLIIGGVIGVLTAVVASLIALQIQRRAIDTTQTQQHAWERAQEGQQQKWEAQQDQRMHAREQEFIREAQQIEAEWITWETKDEERTAALAQQYGNLTSHFRLERQLASSPYVEEIPLQSPGPSAQEDRSIYHWQPLQLQGADLSQRDFSHRYLRQANLRKARLAGAILYMADLSGACLAEADLSGADLSAANLSGADLSGATLVGANLLVADMNDTMLLGTNLLKTRNLATERVSTAIYDRTTRFGEEIDITLPRLPRLLRTPRPELAAATT